MPPAFGGIAFFAYSNTEYLDIIGQFQAHGIRLAVLCVDMDWHIRETGNESPGWTGHTWNNKLFPRPKEFLRVAHEKSARILLNLHPADGVWPHESPFSPDDSSFMREYIKVSHHPLEADGVDLWWIDCRPESGRSIRRRF
jgi:alpha-glucosidase (family GH31 glycosyl hydrolase)